MIPRDPNAILIAPGPNEAAGEPDKCKLDGKSRPGG